MSPAQLEDEIEMRKEAIFMWWTHAKNGRCSYEQAADAADQLLDAITRLRLDAKGQAA